MSKKVKSTPIIKPSFNLDNILSDLPDGQPVFNGGVGKNKNTPQKSSSASNALSNKYAEVRKSDLSTIPIDTYIRYSDLSGNLKPGGGKIKSTEALPDGDVLIKLGKYNMSSKKFYMWSVKLSEISKIYRYTAAEPSASNLSNYSTPTPSTSNLSTSNPSASRPKTEEEQIINRLGDKMLFDDNEMLNQRITNLEAGIQKLDDDVKKIFMLVKRLYNSMGAPA